jgi:DNA (cytosine-5)-methyltransferase 1
LTAFYNEIDPYAAQWLRNLIAAGHIAPGIVDERPIQEIEAYELAGFTQCHFFAGIGVWSLALRQAGWSDDWPIWTGSCPCQPFSAAGKQEGFNDERHLWPAFYSLIDQCRPPVVIGEQVASALDWLDLVSVDMEAADYAFAASDLCAAGFGGAHIRQRLYFAGLDNAAGARHFGEVRGAESTSWDEARLRLSGKRSTDGGLADSERNGWGSDEPGRGSKGRASDGRDSTDGGLANSRCAIDERCSRSSETHGEIGEAESEAQQLQWSGVADRAGVSPSGLEHSMSAGRTERGTVAGNGQIAGSSSSSGLADASTSGRQGPGGSSEEQGQRTTERSGESNSQSAHAPMLGRNPVDWLYCRDGKWRPVEPGTFPLADGATNRVGRLRAYGNALHAETATTFAQTIKEICDDLGLVE